MSTPSRPAVLNLDSWAGRERIPVLVVGETPTRWRVELQADCRLPGRNRQGRRGQVVLVPKSAVVEV